MCNAARALALVALAALVSACDLGLPAGRRPHREGNRLDMIDQPKLKPQRKDIFDARPTVTFTPATSNVPQTVTVMGVDDALVDGSVAYSIVTAAATSADPAYTGVDPSDVSVTNTDNDAAGIVVDPASGLTTTEAGGTATFTVVLTSQPTADVTVGLSFSSDATEGTVAPASVTFTPATWNVTQTVTVTGVDDALVDGSVAYSIVAAAATSADST